jgi:diguanylate cyclase (GGDEF)-like protein/PAS domain S-box-containing protein
MSIGLKMKANITIAVALLALAGMGWLSVREKRNLTEADLWVSHTHEVLDTSASLRSQVSDAGIARRLFVQGDSKQIDVFNAAVVASLAAFKKLQYLTVDNKEQQTRLGLLEPLLKTRLTVLQESITLHLRSRNDQQAQERLTSESIGVIAQFAQQANEFENTERALLRRRSAKSEENARITSTADAILSLSVFVFIVIATAVLNHEWSRRKRIEEAIAQQKALLQSILDTCNDAIVVTDKTGKIILRNPASLQLHGEVGGRVAKDIPQKLGLYKPDEITLLPYEDLPLLRALHGESVDNVEVCVRPPAQGKTYWTLASSRPLLDENAETHGAVVFYRDITQRKELETQLARYADELKRSNVELMKAHGELEQLALSDELTGLHNRRGFLMRAEQSLALAHRAQKSFALLFVDLDGLKNINDTLGHGEGNRAICDAAFALMNCFRRCDVLCRLGGDEFAVLMMDASQEGAEIVKQRIADKVETLNALGKRPYQLSLSVGTLICDFNEELSLEVLLDKADALMYEEKKSKGVNRAQKKPRPVTLSPRVLQIPESSEWDEILKS